jgi:hypothetical protein
MIRRAGRKAAARRGSIGGGRHEARGRAVGSAGTALVASAGRGEVGCTRCEAVAGWWLVRGRGPSAEVRWGMVGCARTAAEARRGLVGRAWWGEVRRAGPEEARRRCIGRARSEPRRRTLRGGGLSSSGIVLHEYQLQVQPDVTSSGRVKRKYIGVPYSALNPPCNLPFRVRHSPLTIECMHCLHPDYSKSMAVITEMKPEE